MQRFLSSILTSLGLGLLAAAAACSDPASENPNPGDDPSSALDANHGGSGARAAAPPELTGLGGSAAGSGDITSRVAGSGGSPHAGSGGAGAPGSGSPSGGGGRASGSGAAGRGAAESGDAGSGGAAGRPPPADIQIWLAGDSTVARGETPCPAGWGAAFQTQFSDRAKVVNGAVGGRSVRTWLYNVGTTLDNDGECTLARDGSGNPTLQARWQQMLDGMKPGDYLFIQFGINDSSATCDRHVGIDAFKQTYGVMAKAAKERGCQPIFVTPVSALSCQGNTARGTRGEFVSATQDAGEQYDVPVIDLHARSVGLYNALGLCPISGGSDVSASTSGKAGDFFCDDHTHFERAGAEQIAELISDALRDQSIELATYLK